MKTFEKWPHLTDECRCGRPKAKIAKTCQACFNELQIGRPKKTYPGIDWTRWVSAC